MVRPFARRPQGEGFFAELVFGALGITVIVATSLTLGTSPQASTGALVPPAAMGAAAALVEEQGMHLVDVSALALAWPAEPELSGEDEGEGEIEDELPAPDEGEPAIDAPARPAKRPQGDGESDAPARAEPSEQDDAGSDGKAPSKGKAKARRCPAPDDPGIVSTAPGRWIIRQSVVQRYTRDWSKLGELGWSKTHRREDGRADGLLIGGLSCGSDLHDAGFRSGDVIHTVNGRKVHSVPQAILAYTALHNDHDFTVEITRRGKRQTLRYQLR